MFIDCDSHFMPRDAFDYIEGPVARSKPILKFDADGRFADIEFPGRAPRLPGTVPLAPPGGGSFHMGMVDIEPRLEDMDRMGVQREFLLPQFTGWWSYLIEPELATAMARSYNLARAPLVKKYPDRLPLVALIALQNLQGAMEELEQIAQQGYKGISMDYCYPVWEHPYGTTLGSHQELWPFFQRCQELDMPVFLHAVPHGHGVANLPKFLGDGLSILAPRDAEMNLVSLITSGLLDDFPRLKIVHTEQGTKYIRPLMQRMDAAFKPETAEKRIDSDEGPGSAAPRPPTAWAPLLVSPERTKAKNQQPPSYYFKNNFWWTIETEEPELADSIQFLGADRFLFSTDYPHEDPGGKMKFRDVELFEGNEGISEEDKELVRSGNAQGLLTELT